jgi:SPP1 gp7 family putative phage head morphogenesis protein
MIDANDPIGRELVALISRLRYERWLGFQVGDILTREFNGVVDLLVSGQYRTLTASQKQRAAQLFRTIAKRIAEAYTAVAAFQAKEMRAYASLEADTTRHTITSLYEAAGLVVAIGAALSAKYLASIGKLLVQGLTTDEWFDAQARTMTLEARRIIQQGLADGVGSYAIASKIVAPASAEGPVLLRRATNDAQVISRTIANAVQNDAQMAVLSSLPATVSDRYVLDVVLDSRTSAICRSLSGRIYRYDDPRRRVPPFHLNCRTTMRPLLSDIEDSLTVQSESRSIRTYDAWLRTRSDSIQDDILGPARASLWRSGSMSLSEAIGNDTRVLNLPQLRARLLEREEAGV